MMNKKIRNTIASALCLAFTASSSISYASPPAPTNVVRYSFTLSPASGSGSSMTMFALDGDSLMNGLPAVWEGYVSDQATGQTVPFSYEVPAKGVHSITTSPPVPNAVAPMTTYQLFQDGAPLPYELEMETGQDPLKANSFIHTGVITNLVTGEQTNFVAHNDPIPVIVVVGAGAILLICGASITREFINSCAARAARACAPWGVKKVEAKVTGWSLLSGCRTECKFECNPPRKVEPAEREGEQREDDREREDGGR